MPSPDLEFDLNDDGIVSRDDRVTWVYGLKGPLLGRCELGRQVGLRGFVEVFIPGKYETEETPLSTEGVCQVTECSTQMISRLCLPRVAMKKGRRKR